ncbi:hypothetical protein ACFY3U_15360 [Micromonospora sp. NPDC000089]|uniref:hypothetical protein n=1 Tax=unclassified Micromonospora TaxID=2617518 RepID=UPI0036D18600
MNLRLTGGAMQVWSDLDGAHGPGPVRGAVLVPLLATATGRTLVVGPLDPALVDAVPVDDLTVLVRGVPDAEALAAARPKVTVWCGGPEELTGEPPFDTVIALDGLGRLCSTEGAELPWGETFALLAAAVRPGGRLLLAVENHLGLHRLVALPPEPTDSDWADPGEYDPTRPAGLPRVLATLTRAGFTPVRAYTGWPSPVAPAALLGPDLLADESVLGYLQATLGPVCAPTDTVLTDPDRLLSGALRHGAATDLAPAWILVADSLDADRTGGSAADRAGGSGTDRAGVAAPGVGRPADELPEALLAAGAGHVEVSADPAGGWVRHEVDRVTPVPSGRTLEDLLLAAALRRDLPVVRELLGGWQAGPHAGVPADRVVVGPAGTPEAVAPAGEPMAALRRLAGRMIDGGLAHLWPSPALPGELAQTLAVVAGRGAEPVPPAAADEPDRPAARAYRELLVERDVLTRELAEARAKQQWYERTLTEREEALKRARRIVALLSGTPTARAGKVLLAGARTARRTARAAVRRMRSDD